MGALQNICCKKESIPKKCKPMVWIHAAFCLFPCYAPWAFSQTQLGLGSSLDIYREMLFPSRVRVTGRGQLYPVQAPVPAAASIEKLLPQGERGASGSESGLSATCHRLPCIAHIPRSPPGASPSNTSLRGTRSGLDGMVVFPCAQRQTQNWTSISLGLEVNVLTLKNSYLLLFGGTMHTPGNLSTARH